jgi:DNA-binding HxlR family transcriptional regulator
MIAPIVVFSVALPTLARDTPLLKVGTKKFYTYLKESDTMSKHLPFSDAQIAKAKYYASQTPPTALDPRVEALVKDLIGQVADKWTMLILEVLMEHGEVRFTRIASLVDGISQKMLTQTLRHMERDGLLSRKVYPVVPPKVEYRLTDLGLTLSAAFCGVWVWAAENLKQIERARRKFDQRTSV